MSVLNKPGIGAKERAEIFRETYDSLIDPAQSLATLVEAAGNYLEIVIGDAADEAMMMLVDTLGPVQAKEGSSWRDLLRANSANCYSEWRIGTRLHDLSAYAYFGITLTEQASPREWLADLIAEALRFRDMTPSNVWLKDGQADVLERTISLAENRWALDNGEPVDSLALAYFGGVSEGRMRNMMSGKDRQFRTVDGKVPADEALRWLSGRESFWDSIWQNPEGGALPVEDQVAEPAFVPVARDGSIFHRGLKRSGSFTIGPKGEERHVPSFEEALVELQKMPVPYWRRPNPNDAWGIVRGVRWERVDLSRSDFTESVKQVLGVTRSKASDCIGD